MKFSIWYLANGVIQNLSAAVKYKDDKHYIFKFSW